LFVGRPGHVELLPGWLTAAEADALFSALANEVSWTRHRLRIFGREVDAPRLSCWIGDPEAAYRYSGTRFAPQPWPDALQPIRDRVSDVAGVDFNSVLANLYRDGRDAMGWHSDDESELGPQPVNASPRLGTTRRFVPKARRPDADGKLERRVIELPYGSLLLMRGDTQARYGHALPRSARTVRTRINLTFREIMG